MSKIINIQRSIVVDLDWLERELEKRNSYILQTEDEATKEFLVGSISALNKVKQTSTPLSKVCEVAVSKGLFIASPVSDINIAEKSKQDFLQSKIEIDE